MLSSLVPSPKLTVSTNVQFLNADSPITTTLAGITITFAPMPSNADAPMVSSLPFAARLKVLTAIQPLNALSPMVLTLAGITMLSTRAAPSNADTPMLSSTILLLSLPNATDSSAIQPAKALSPMVLTFEEISMDLRFAQFSNTDSLTAARALFALKFTVSMAVQFLNADLPIATTLAGITTSFAPMPSNADAPMVSSLPFTARLKVSTDVQFLNAESPIVLTLAGITMLVTNDAPSNADAPMLSSTTLLLLLPNATDSSAIQPAKALSPMVLTFEGISMDLRFAQFSNADTPMPATPELRVTLSMYPHPKNA